MSHVPRVKVAAAKPQAQPWAFDSIAAWALSLGAAAVALALFVYFIVGAPLAATYILVATAGLIAIFLREISGSSQAG